MSGTSPTPEHSIGSDIFLDDVALARISQSPLVQFLEPLRTISPHGAALCRFFRHEIVADGAGPITTSRYLRSDEDFIVKMIDLSTLAGVRIVYSLPAHHIAHLPDCYDQDVDILANLNNVADDVHTRLIIFNQHSQMSADAWSYEMHLHLRLMIMGLNIPPETAVRLLRLRDRYETAYDEWAFFEAEHAPASSSGKILVLGPGLADPNFKFLSWNMSAIDLGAQHVGNQTIRLGKVTLTIIRQCQANFRSHNVCRHSKVQSYSG